MENIVPRTGIEPTSLAFPASVLTITPPRLSDVTTVPTPTNLCGFLPERLVQTTSIIIIIIIIIIKIITTMMYLPTLYHHIARQVPVPQV